MPPIWVELEVIISALLGPTFDYLSHFCFQGKSYQEVWCLISADINIRESPGAWPPKSRKDKAGAAPLNKAAWAISCLLTPSFSTLQDSVCREKNRDPAVATQPAV